MHKIEFAYILNEILNSLHISTDNSCDIIDLIYAEYIKHNYENYTLFELLSMLDKQRIYISCLLSKRALIKFVDNNKIDLPYLLSADKHKTNWSIYNLQYLDYITYPHITHVNKNIIIVHDTDTVVYIDKDDIFKINNTRYKISDITQETITLQDMDTITHEITSYTTANFITLLDKDDNISIERNQQRNKLLSYV